MSTRPVDSVFGVPDQHGDDHCTAPSGTTKSAECQNKSAYEGSGFFYLGGARQAADGPGPMFHFAALLRLPVDTSSHRTA